MAWNPSAYLKFGSARLRPAIDLLNKTVTATADARKVKSVLDLGCGPGNLTEFLCQSFPAAVVEGIDSSEAMINRAWNDNKKSSFKDRISFKSGTAEEVANCDSKKYDIIYSNATLHWCVKHDALFSNLVKNCLEPSGVLAVQMPDTRIQPSHVLMEAAAFQCGFADLINEARIPRVDNDPSWYFDFLHPLCKDIDMWSTEYIQQVTSSTSRHPVLEFTKSTGLMPILEALGGEGDERCKKFLNEYDRLLCDAYPSTQLQNGQVVTLFPYKRFFLVCTKS